jgi:hypothetical protein
MYPYWLVLPARGFAALALAVELWQVVQVARYQPPWRLSHIRWALWVLYPLGIALKVGEVGPDWVRWYLADVGFPVVVGWAIAELIMLAHDTTPAKRLSERLRQHVRLLKVQLVGLAVALLLAVLYELVIGHAAEAVRRTYPDTHVYAGGFDWIDIACYVLGSVTAGGVFWYWRARVKAIIPEVLATEKVEATRATADAVRDRRSKEGKLRRRRRR